MTWDAISWGFFLGMVKFLFAAAFLEVNYPQLSVLQVFLITFSGAFSCFNLTYWPSEYLMLRAKKKRIEALKSGKKKRKKAFTKLNKTIVRIKLSKFGFYILCTAGVLLMSIPISGIVIAKFYGDSKKSYFLSILTIIVTAFVLALFSGAVSDYVRA